MHKRFHHRLDTHGREIDDQLVVLERRFDLESITVGILGMAFSGI